MKKRNIQAVPVRVVAVGLTCYRPAEAQVGDEYPSTWAAAQATGIARQHITMQLNGDVPHCHGIRFERVKNENN